MTVILGESHGHSELLNPHLELRSEDNYVSPIYFAKLFSNLTTETMKPFENGEVLHTQKTQSQ